MLVLRADLYRLSPRASTHPTGWPQAYVTGYSALRAHDRPPTRTRQPEHTWQPQRAHSHPPAGHYRAQVSTPHEISQERYVPYDQRGGAPDARHVRNVLPVARRSWPPHDSTVCTLLSGGLKLTLFLW